MAIDRTDVEASSSAAASPTAEPAAEARGPATGAGPVRHGSAMVESNRWAVREARAWVVGAALLVAIVVGLIGDRYFAHGLTATYRRTSNDETTELARVLEHRVAFPNGQRARARYLQNWDFATHGPPSAFPPLDAVLRGTVTVPDGPARAIRAVTKGRALVLVGGRDANTHPVAPGTHGIEVRWTGDLSLEASLALRWAGPGVVDEPIADAAFRPAQSTAGRRIAWAAAIGAWRRGRC